MRFSHFYIPEGWGLAFRQVMFLIELERHCQLQLREFCEKRGLSGRMLKANKLFGVKEPIAFGCQIRDEPSPALEDWEDFHGTDDLPEPEPGERWVRPDESTEAGARDWGLIRNLSLPGITPLIDTLALRRQVFEKDEGVVHQPILRIARPACFLEVPEEEGERSWWRSLASTPSELLNDYGLLELAHPVEGGVRIGGPS